MTSFLTPADVIIRSREGNFDKIGSLFWSVNYTELPPVIYNAFKNRYMLITSHQT